MEKPDVYHTGANSMIKYKKIKAEFFMCLDLFFAIINWLIISFW